MDTVIVQCPFCFETQEIEIALEEKGKMVQDCEVCCRPWDVTVTRDEDGEPHVWVDKS